MSIAADRAFLVKHQERISGILSCFDRVIFRGYLPMSYARGVEGFFYQRKVPLKKFNDYATRIAERIKQHVKAQVEQAGAPYRHLPTKEPMEEQACAMARAKNIRAGIVCGYSQLETART